MLFSIPLSRSPGQITTPPRSLEHTAKSGGTPPLAFMSMAPVAEEHVSARVAAVPTHASHTDYSSVRGVSASLRHPEIGRLSSR